MPLRSFVVVVVLAACGGQPGPAEPGSTSTGAPAGTTTAAEPTGTTGTATGTAAESTGVTGTATGESSGGATEASTGAPPACVENEHPGPEVELRCAACIVVEDKPGFCADGVLNPACVDGVWKCVEDTIPVERCRRPGAPCELDPETGTT